MLITPCCCGGSGTNCGQSCSACGGVHLTGGTVTDDNGTWDLTGSNGSWSTGTLSFNATGTHDQYCQAVSGTVALPYKWTLSCQNNQLVITLLTPTIEECNTDLGGGSGCGYLNSQVMSIGPWQATLTPDCSDKTITASATLPAFLDTSICIYPPFTSSANSPSRNVSISLDIEQPGTGPCCCTAWCSSCGGICPDLPGTAVVSGFGTSCGCPLDGTTTAASYTGGTGYVFYPPGCTDSFSSTYFTVQCNGDGTWTATLWVLFEASNQIQIVATASSNITCNGTDISGTFTNWTLVYKGWCPLGIPSNATLKLSGTIESPQHRLCCSPCGIPQKDLTLSWTSTRWGPGSTTLAYSSASQNWTARAKIGSIIPITCLLTCNAGTIDFAYDFYGEGGLPCTVIPTAYTQTVRLVSYTCDPFHLQLDGNAPINPCTDMTINNIVIYIDE